MVRKTVTIFVLILALSIQIGCATYTANTQGPSRSPLEQAKLNYVASSLDYEFTMKTLVELRRARLVNDAQWSRIDKAQGAVQEWAPLVRSMLDAWQTFGDKPANFDAAMLKLAAAFAEIHAVKGEVR